MIEISLCIDKYDQKNRFNASMNIPQSSSFENLEQPRDSTRY